MVKQNFRFLKLALVLFFLAALFFNIRLLSFLKNDILTGHGDFVSFYTAAEIFKAGEGNRLYDYQTQLQYQQKYQNPNRSGPLPFIHPPFELLLLLPLSFLPYPTAYFTWSGMNIGFLLATFCLMYRHIGKPFQAIFGFMLVAYYPIYITIAQGQDSILLTFIFAALFASLKMRRRHLGGAMLALGLFKPQLVFPAIYIVLLTRRWGVLNGFLTGSICLGAISVAMVGRHGMIQFVNLVTTMNQQQYTMDPAVMPNIRGLVDSLLGAYSSTVATTVIALLSLLLLLLLGYAWKGGSDPDTRSFDMKFGFLLTVTVLISYHLNTHDLTLLALSAILTLNRVFTDLRLQELRCRVFLWLILLLWLPLTYTLLLKYGKLSWLSLVILALGTMQFLAIHWLKSIELRQH